MSIQTPLGKDVLLLSSFTADEEISRLFKVTAELVHEGTAGGDVPHVIDPATILGKAVLIQISQRDGTTRHFHGIVNRFEQRNRDDRFTHFQAEIVPELWLHTLNRQSRIFQNKTVKEILENVLKVQHSIELTGTYEKRNYCVQYRETDFDFVSRLMEEEGIFYYFEHTANGHNMIIADAQQAHRNCPTKSTVTFDLDQADGEDFVSVVREWTVNHRLQPGKVTFWDHKFEIPFNKLDATQPTRFSLAATKDLEIYDYPGSYARKFDGIDSGGGEQSGELNRVFTDKTAFATKAMESIDAGYKVITGVGDMSSMTPGFKFTLENHPVSSTNGAYVLTSVSHSAMQSPDYSSEDTVLDPYNNAFNCIPVGNESPTYRPERLTPRPFVQGPQTATVVGPAGEEIFVDKYGRVKVQFRWDREGQVNQGSSCWMRVAQNWAGKKWGTMFIPRIGMEVIVDFIEGDPDQPIIIGSVYNADTMPPYNLPDEKTKSTIKTNSSTGGGGFNELRFEDKKGSEQIFIHAQKDQDIRVKNDCKEIIMRDRHLIVENKQVEKVKKDKHLEVVGNQNEKIGGSLGQTIGGSHDVKISQKYAAEAGQEVHLKAGMTTVIEAGTSLTLKVGGNFININPGGVFVKGTMVMLNSGGAAGSGSGASPASPEQAMEADNAEAGQKPGLPPAPPAIPPKEFAQLQTFVQQGNLKPESLKGGATQAAQAAQKAVEEKKDEVKKELEKLKDKAQGKVNSLAAAVAALSNKAGDMIKKAKEMAAAAKNKVEEMVNKAKAAAEDAKDKVEAKVEEAKEKLAEAKAEAKEKVNEAKKAAEEAKQKAQEAVGEAKQAATEAAEKAKEKAAEVQQQAEEKVAEAQKAVDEAKQEVAAAKEKAAAAVEETKQQAEQAVEQVSQQAAQALQSAQNANPFQG